MMQGEYDVINKETKDILLASAGDIAGQKVNEAQDPIMQGLSTVIDTLNTDFH